MTSPSPRRHFIVIGCAVLQHELAQAASQSPHQVDIHIISKGLHDIGCSGMRSHLQKEIDSRAKEDCDAILLAYGLCNLGITELKAPSHCPLVVTRAHDCITLFMGSRKTYAKYFSENPGTYFLTPGWIEHGDDVGEFTRLTMQSRMGMNDSYDELVSKYGEDNAEYLWKELHQTMQHYSAITYIDTGAASSKQFEEEAHRRAAEKKWEFHSLKGNTRLLQALLAGEWDPEEFLTVPAGHTIRETYDDYLIQAVPPA